MRATERPNEPVTTGAPLGPGGGPEVMAMGQSGANSADDAADLEALRPYLPALELMAGLPNSSAAARNFVRRLRGGMPAPNQPGQQAPSTPGPPPGRP